MEAIQAKQSQVVNFYNNRSVFITGGSGFVGKVLIEKLLRSCPGVDRIYVLIRSKRGKSAQDRLHAILQEPLFDKVRNVDANQKSINERVIGLEGDVTEPNLGLTEDNLLRLVNEVSVIYHSAATVKFDDPLKQSVAINIKGTKHILELCRRILNLAALVHVSTAYANCDRAEIDEHIYPVDMDPENLIRMADWLDQDTMQALKEKLLDKRPNTYTYTKALGEWLLVKSAADLPVVVVRPSIVVATCEEPVSGWVDNVNGPTGVLLGAGKGLVRTMVADESLVADLVPVDIVINNIIAAAWFASLYKCHGKSSPVNEYASLSASSRCSSLDDDTCDTIKNDLNGDDEFKGPFISSSANNNCQSQTNQNLLTTHTDGGQSDYHSQSASSSVYSYQGGNDQVSREKRSASLDDKLKKFRNNVKAKLVSKNLGGYLADVPVFHCTSGAENPITWGQIRLLAVSMLALYPSISLYRYPNGKFTGSTSLDTFYSIFLHYIPALLVDFVMRLCGRKPMLYKIFKKFDQAALVLRAFTMSQWKFSPDNRQALMNDFMNECDRNIFNCDIAQINWNQYHRSYVLGLRRYLLKEPDNTIDEARANLAFVYYRNLALQVLFVAITLYLVLGGQTIANLASTAARGIAAVV